MDNLRYLFLHTGWAEHAIESHQNMANTLRQAGVDITAFCVTPNAPARWYPFSHLDRLWRNNDSTIIKLHDQLRELAADYDVLINHNGAHVHPAWLKDLPTFNVYICWDDPESSEFLSEPVAKYFDFSFTGNAACVPLYQSWGITRCDFLPYAVHDGHYDPSLTVEQILHGNRDNDIVFLGERVSRYRNDRLDALAQAFPQAFLAGRGWPKGYVDNRLEIYQHSRIGWNVHNSVGPVNLRTYALPANGILQICDNKCRLGSIFELDKEVIGYDSLEECIDLTHYYLDHENERRKIAAHGFLRVFEDYTEERRWERLVSTIEPYYELKKTGALDVLQYEDDADASKRMTSPGRSFVVNIVKKTARRFGLEISRTKPRPNPGPARDIQSPSQSDDIYPYVENPEGGALNLEIKQARLDSGGFFEWPNMVALNWAVAGLIPPNAKRIVELGGGTGLFAYEAAVDPKRTILCSEYDSGAHLWAKTHRNRSNIIYTNDPVSVEKNGYFDLVVSVEVIEHIADYKEFLDTCVALAPMALFTTPNKNRTRKSAQIAPPENDRHVREWTAGEFYWVLRTFYSSVKLYSMQNVYIPQTTPIRITDNRTPLIALCSSSI